MNRFTANGMPSQAGKRAVVTGANSGIGFETALALAQAGAEVILAVRSEIKGGAAVARILALSPSAKLRLELVDLSKLTSIADFSGRLNAEGQPLDLLINNAGVMALPQRQVTVDGFEMQLGVNYLGHYALTAQLLPLLRKATAPRVVNLSSVMHWFGKIHFDDVQLEHGYTPNKAYAQSKLAMLMFAMALQRRSYANGWGLMSLASHPGIATTELIVNGQGSEGFVNQFSLAFVRLVGQSAAAGALPTLYAATSHDVQEAGYYGPDGFAEIRGEPAKARTSAWARDVDAAQRLWDVSATLTGATFA